MSEFTKLIAAQKEYLPAKAKRDMLPQIIWILAPAHQGFRNNELREKFNLCLLNMLKLVPDTNVLSLKKIWNPQDGGNVMKFGHFTVSGYQQYWEAVDHTIRYADTTFMPKKSGKERT